jgi:hypothetical protein
MNMRPAASNASRILSSEAKLIPPYSCSKREIVDGATPAFSARSATDHSRAARAIPTYAGRNPAFDELIAELQVNKVKPAKGPVLPAGVAEAADRARKRRGSCAYGGGVGALKYTGAW